MQVSGLYAGGGHAWPVARSTLSVLAALLRIDLDNPAGADDLPLWSASWSARS